MSISISTLMPPKKNQTVSPRAGRQDSADHTTSKQIPTAVPQPVGCRSERICAQELRKAQSIGDKAIATETQRRTTQKTGLRRGRPRKSEPERITPSPTHKAVIPRDHDSVSAHSTPLQNHTGRSQESIERYIQTINTPHDLERISEEDPETRKLRLYAVYPPMRLDSWLKEVRASPTTDADPYLSDGDNSSDMEPSTSSSTRDSGVTDASTEQQSTVRQGKKEKADKKVPTVSLADGLRTRQVEFEERFDDPKTAELKELIVPSPEAIPSEHIQSLFNKIELFLNKSRNLEEVTTIYDKVEELSDAINKWKSTAHMATITNKEFDMDLEHCKYPANEHVFQRTVMMSILNRHQINDKFDFNCEGVWSLRSSYYALSSLEENNIPAPKPDLAIFFHSKSLIGKGPWQKSMPVPKELKACINPDGSFHRCFPFIFIEAKKGFHDLTPALLANMHSASQALLNIYAWMSAAGHTEIFFSDVRLFSIAINAEKFALRVHRAEASDERDSLGYFYDDICKGYEYKRDHICSLIKNILVGYAEKTLLEKLKSTVLAVLENEEQTQVLKRKRGLAGGNLFNKRVTREPSEKIGDPSTSFGISGVNLA